MAILSQADLYYFIIERGDKGVRTQMRSMW